jgi:hypothetical protein
MSNISRMSIIENQSVRFFCENPKEIINDRVTKDSKYLPLLLKSLAYDKSNNSLFNKELNEKLVSIIGQSSFGRENKRMFLFFAKILFTENYCRELPRALNRFTQNTTFMRTCLSLDLTFRINQRSLVMSAYYRGQLKLVKLLLLKGYVPSTALLQSALFKNERELARLAVEVGVELNCKDEWSRYPLHNAAASGDISLVELMIRRGAHLDLRDLKFRDFLCENPKFLQLFIDENITVVNIDAVDDHGRTFLHEAAGYGNYPFIEFLLKKGALAEVQQNETKERAFDIALGFEHFDVARLLSKHAGASYETVLAVKFYGHLLHKSGTYLHGKQAINYEYFSTTLASEKLSELGASFFSERREEICQRFSLTHEDCNWFCEVLKETAGNLVEDPGKLMQRMTQKPLVFMTGWRIHIIGMILDDEVIIRCDCDDEENSGIHIFTKGEESSLIELISTMQKARNTLLERECFYEEMVKKLALKHDDTVALEPQTVSNCATIACAGNFIALAYRYFKKRKGLSRALSESQAKALGKMWIDTHVIPKAEQLLVHSGIDPASIRQST